MEKNIMENKEQTKDYLIFIIKPDWIAIEIRFRTMNKELYNDFLFDYNLNNDSDGEKFIFEYDKVIKNFTWENYEHYFKHELKEIKDFSLNDSDRMGWDLYTLLRIFDPKNILYIDENFDDEGYYDSKKAIEIIIEELKHIKNTRNYEYEYDTYFPYYE